MTFSALFKSISRREWYVVFAIAAAIFIFTSVPFISGQLTTPADSIYTPNYHRASGDTYVYLSMIEEARQGALTFHNLFTGEPHPPVLINPLWWFLGVIGRYVHIDNGWLLQIARSALIFLTVPVVYLTIALFCDKRPRRLLATILALSVSGFGYFYYRFLDPSIMPDIFTINFYSTPTDIWLTEAHPLLLFLASPHFQLSLICLLLSLIFFFLGLESGLKRYFVYSGLLNLLLAVFHPYETVFIFFVMLVATVAILLWPGHGWRQIWKTIGHFLIAAAVALPGLLYQVYIFYSQPVFKSWAWQSNTTSPDYLLYLWGFGIFVPLTVLGIVLIIRRLNKRYVFLLTWFLITIPLLYSPFPFNRRFIEGIFVPIGIVSAIAISHLYERLVTRPAWPRQLFVIIAIVVLFTSIAPTNLYNWWSFLEVQRLYKVVPFYLAKDEKTAMDWITKSVQPGEVILSGHISGFLIPAFTARPVYLGHDLQTAYFSFKKPLMEWFYRDDSEADVKKEFLEQNQIRYVYFGPNERTSGSFDPDTKDYLEPAFAAGRVEIYKVKM